MVYFLTTNALDCRILHIKSEKFSGSDTARLLQWIFFLFLVFLRLMSLMLLIDSVGTSWSVRYVFILCTSCMICCGDAYRRDVPTAVQVTLRCFPRAWRPLASVGKYKSCVSCMCTAELYDWLYGSVYDSRRCIANSLLVCNITMYGFKFLPCSVSLLQSCTVF